MTTIQGMTRPIHQLKIDKERMEAERINLLARCAVLAEGIAEKESQIKKQKAKS